MLSKALPLRSMLILMLLSRSLDVKLLLVSAAVFIRKTAKPPTAKALTTLITVEYFRLSLIQSDFQCIKAKQGILRIRQLPGQNIPAIPVDDGHQIHKPFYHGNKGAGAVA